jgi:hypothetical protein
MASLVQDMSPFLKWSLAIIAGGGAAGTIQGMTVLARGASLIGTGGFANPLIATVELGGSVITSILALAAPVLAVFLVTGVAVVGGTKVYRKLARRSRTAIK